MTTILTLTLNPTIDLSWDIDRLDDEGKVRAGVRSTVAGGGGINVARAVARLGGSATAVHTSGRDVGRRLDRLLDDEHLHHRAVAIAEETREALVLFETEAERTFHVVPRGPSLTQAEGERCLDVLTDALADGDLVVLSGSLPGGLPDDFYISATREVNQRGGRVVLDSSGPALHHALGEPVAVLKPNKREAGELVGRTIEDFDDARVANDHLLDRGAAAVVVTTLGDKGALCSSSDGHTEVHAPPLLGPPLSDAGAGDSFVAALTYGLARGGDPVDACVAGVAAASASVLTPGTELFDASQAEHLAADVQTRRCGSA